MEQLDAMVFRAIVGVSDDEFVYTSKIMAQVADIMPAGTTTDAVIKMIVLHAQARGLPISFDHKEKPGHNA